MLFAFLHLLAQTETTAGGGGDNSSLPELLGLGIITVALVTGQWLYHKYIYTPTLNRADKALDAATTAHNAAIAELNARHDKAMAEVRATADKMVAEERARSDRLEGEVKRQNDVLQEKALPALIASAATVTESQALLRELRRDQEVVQRERDREAARALALEQAKGG